MALVATLVEHRVVSIESLKSTWTIQPADVLMVDGTAFVRVAGYAPLPILTENLDVPYKLRYLSPSVSKGLSELLKLREEAEERAATEEDSACALFAPAKKKAKISKDIVSEKRHNPKSVEIEIEVNDETIPIDVVRQVHRKDNLFVAYDATQLSAIIQFIRGHGFQEVPTPEKLQLPKGISQRKEKFIVTYEKADGCIGYKTKNTVEDAISWQLENAQKEIVSECGNASPLEDHDFDAGVPTEEPCKAEDLPTEEPCEAEEQHNAIVNAC